MVVPSAPGLVKLTNDGEFRNALTEADMAIADSGFMVLLWRMVDWSPITRISGLTPSQAVTGGSGVKETEPGLLGHAVERIGMKGQRRG